VRILKIYYLQEQQKANIYYLILMTIFSQHFKTNSGLFHPRPVLKLFAAKVLCVLSRISFNECKFPIDLTIQKKKTKNLLFNFRLI
jgi:hypothetical protein